MKAYGIVVALLVAPVAWVAAASAVLCAAMDKWAVYSFPARYWQWIVAIPYWRMAWHINPKLDVMLVVSAAAPTLVLVLVIVAIIQRRLGGRKRPNLFGETGFAQRDDMLRGGMTMKDRPF